MTTATDTIDEAQFKLRAIARPTWTDTRSASLARAARIVNIPISLAERIAYKKIKRLDAHVLDNIRTVYARLETRAEMAADIQLKRAEFARGDFHAGTEVCGSGDDGVDSGDDLSRR